jgi:transcriptional regulator with GAF, ATPase, and Fis domain
MRKKSTPITTAAELEALLADVIRAISPSGGMGASGSTGAHQAPAIATLRSARTQFERDYITAALREHDWRVPDAARVLGVQSANLYRKMRRLRISRVSNGPDSAHAGDRVSA